MPSHNMHTVPAATTANGRAAPLYRSLAPILSTRLEERPVLMLFVLVYLKVRQAPIHVLTWLDLWTYGTSVTLAGRYSNDFSPPQVIFLYLFLVAQHPPVAHPSFLGGHICVCVCVCLCVCVCVCARECVWVCLCINRRLRCDSRCSLWNKCPLSVLLSIGNPHQHSLGSPFCPPLPDTVMIDTGSISSC